MKDDQETKFWLKPKNLAIILIIIGVIIYLLSSLLVEVIPPLKQGDIFIDKSWKFGCFIFLDILKLLSGVIISSGFISLLLEISTIKKLVFGVYKTLMNNILTAKFDLTNYSDETLKSFKRRIILQINKNKLKTDQLNRNKLTEEMLSNSIYTLEENLNNLVTGLYHELNDEKYIITPDEDLKVFKKEVELKYIVCNHFGNNNFIKYEKIFQQCSTQGSEQIFEVKEFKINNIDLIHEVPNLVQINSIKNKFHILFERVLQKCERHEVILKYEYKVPMSDFTQSFTLLLPCKKFCHTVYLDGFYANNWELSVNGFSSFYFDGSELNDKFKVHKPTPRSALISYDGWTLPGNGYVVSFRRIS